MAEGPRTAGWIASVRRLVGTLSAIVQNRLDLIGVEAAEEKLRLLEALLLGIGFFFLSMLGLLVLTVGVLFVVSPDWRPWVLLAFAVLYLGGAAAALLTLSKRVRAWPPPFAGTIEELKKDLECLRPKD